MASCRAFSDVGDDDTQPPHVQAKKAYRKYSKNADGSSKTLLITSEYGGKTNPKPLRFKIDCTGIREDTGFDATFILLRRGRGFDDGRLFQFDNGGEDARGRTRAFSRFSKRHKKP